MKIYTKTGDDGTTSLVGGKRISKSHLRIECYGTVDELNAHLGLLHSQLLQNNLQEMLRQIQEKLFSIGSSLACDSEAMPILKLLDINEEDITLLESRIDSMNESLPVMKHFILPGGHTVVAQAHVCRCVCRRAERLCAMLVLQNNFIEPIIIKYLNRLSDYLFVLARFIGMELAVEEIPWRLKKQLKDK